MTSADPARRQALLAAKLGALVVEHWGNDGGESSEAGAFPSGATRWHAPSRTGWVLLDRPAVRGLGSALAWAGKVGAQQVHVLVDDTGEAGILARRARAFARPPEVWAVEGRAVRAADPAPPPMDEPLPDDVAAFAGELRAAGADVVAEHGVLTGEVLGLEVARVVVDKETGEAHLEVGVGRHDREARSMLPGAWSVRSLAEVVELVRSHRRPGAEPHPLNRLAGERWLRAVVLHDPSLAGAAELGPAPSPLPRGDLRKPAPAVASGVDPDGTPVVVVCSIGVDLDLVPTAADARLADGRNPCRLRVVVPEPDALPVTDALAAALAEPATVVTVSPQWRAASSP